MAITWTAKLKDISGIEQVHFRVKDSSKVIGIWGTYPLNEDETTTEPILDWVKAKLGEETCTEFEENAASIDDALPNDFAPAGTLF